MRFSSRVPFTLAPNDWSARVAALRRAGATTIDLTEANPTRTGLGPGVPALPAAWSGAALARYDPDPLGAVGAREAIARYHADRGHSVGPDAIVLTAGTSEAYAHAFRLLADPGEAVLVPQPSYPLFVPLARAEGVAVVPYRLAWDGRWHVDFANLEQAIGPRARAIVVVQPNHPTGSCLAPDEQRRLAELAARRGLAIVSDEVFADFAWPAEFRGAGEGFRNLGRPRRATEAVTSAPAPAPPPAPGDGSALPSFAGEREALTLVLSGVSKVCGLPQMKAGWIAVAGPAAARRAAVQRLEWLADLFLSVAAPAQLALPEWLAHRGAFQARARARIAGNLEQLAAACGRTPALTVLPADGGWTAVVRLPARRDEAGWTNELLDRGVIVHPGHFHDFDMEPVVVVSLIVPPEPFVEGIARLERAVADN